MLKLDEVDFTCGRASFVDSLKHFQEPTAKVFVKICLEDRSDFGFYAQLDTGAASSDWPPGKTFLGYSGLLDSIRFALDPQRNHFYFGPGD